MRAIRSLLCVLAGAAALQAAPVFTGVLVVPGLELFALADSAAEKPARWLRRGQEFEGYTVGEYAPDTETLALRKAGETIRLQLRQPKVLELKADPAAMLRTAKQELARNENWPEPVQVQGPHLFKGNWIVVAHHEAGGRIETRVVVFTATGLLREYLRP